MATHMAHDEKPSVENQETIDDSDANPNVQRVQVLSVGLNDALSKDVTSPWSWAMLRICGVIAITTLSMWLQLGGLLIINIDRLLYERLRRHPHVVYQRHGYIP